MNGLRITEQAAVRSGAAASSTATFDEWRGDPHFMQSLARGLLALEAVTAGRGRPVSARAIAAHTGLSVAAARRCLYTLDALGYLRVNRNGAVAGPAFAALAARHGGASPLVARCGPILDALHLELEASVSLAMFDGDAPIVVASSSSDAILRLDLPVGAVLPVHATAAGKVMLAALPAEALDRRLEGLELDRFAPGTIVSPERLREEIVTTRVRGYALADQELARGIRSAAVAVSDRRGTVIGSVNVTALAAALPLRTLKAGAVPALARAAALLSRLTT